MTHWNFDSLNSRTPAESSTMENQHRRITGYRELTQAEIDLMNEIKALGAAIEPVMRKVRAHIDAQYARLQSSDDEPMAQEMKDELQRLSDADPIKWINWASDGMQANLMYATRAVAQPTFF